MRSSSEIDEVVALAGGAGAPQLARKRHAGDKHRQVARRQQAIA
jgi:hypothetical protein